MGFLNNYLHTIKEKFPEQGDRIEELYQRSEDFRALCSDYHLCIKYLQKIKKEAGEKKLSVEEYKNVRAELENELTHFIFRL